MQRLIGRARMLRRPVIHVPALLAIGCAGVFLLNGSAFAIGYVAEVNGETRTLDLQRYRPQGQQEIYLSLKQIVSDLGGTIEVLTTRASIRLNDRLAWVQLNDTRVGGVQPFSLDHRVISDDGDAFIAAVEAPLFFREAFAISLRPQAEPEASPALESLESLTTETRARLTQDVIDRLPELIDVVVIDPGHGGYQRGVESLTGLTEKDITLAVAQRLKDRLSDELPQTIALTRDEDAPLTVADRLQRADAAGGDLIVSLHCGASFSNAVSGAAVFYSPAGAAASEQTFLRRNDPELMRALETSAISKGVAESIAEAIHAAEGLPLRGVAETPLRLQRAHTPVVLVEIGYLTNPSEEAELGSTDRQAKIADAIATGLIALLDGPDRPDPDPAGGAEAAELEAVEAQE